MNKSKKDISDKQMINLRNIVLFSFTLNSWGVSPSSSSSASASAFLSLSCSITVLATDANVRFMGGDDKVAEVMSALEEEGESFGAIASKPAGAEADWESLQTGGLLGTLEEQVGEETSVFLPDSEEEEFNETVSDGDLGGDFVEVESLDLVAAWADGWEDWWDSVGLMEFSCFVRAAEVS